MSDTTNAGLNRTEGWIAGLAHPDELSMHPILLCREFKTDEGSHC
jgi:hypothetical protein